MRAPVERVPSERVRMACSKVVFAGGERNPCVGTAVAALAGVLSELDFQTLQLG